MSFDFIAPFYDLLARLVFGRAISRSQTRFLLEIPSGAKVLILGGGTGWILLDIFRQANPSEVLYLEASSHMLAKAQETAAALPEGERKRISWLQGTEQEMQPGAC